MTRNSTAIKILFMMALALFSVPLTYAAVSVESFTCNGMSGTVVVENGATFSCQASIKNEDTQNSANIGSVSLLVDGSWAEKTSYTGSDFSTSLGASASATATFSGMKAVSPGATHKFQSIQIDSASDTTVTNTNVNVIVIKSVTATASSSSVAQGSEFDVSATAVAGGDLGSATLTWSGSGGCAVSSGHAAAKDVGSMSHNAETTATWRIIQGSAECVSTITASGTSSSVTTTKSKSATVSVTAGSSSSSSSSSSGGGGGGGGGGSASSSKTIKEIKAGASASVDFAKAVNNILIETVNTVQNVVITVSEISSTNVPGPSGDIYKYIEISAANITDSDIKSAKISFHVTKEWLAGKDKNSVRLHRYNNNSWNELATTLSSENATDVKYTAETPGFSTFAITAQPALQPAAQPEQPQQPSQPNQPNQNPSQGQQETTNIGGVEVPKAVADYGVVIIILVLIIVAVLGWLHYHSPWRHKKSSYEYKPKK